MKASLLKVCLNQQPLPHNKPATARLLPLLILPLIRALIIPFLALAMRQVIQPFALVFEAGTLVVVGAGGWAGGLVVAAVGEDY